MRTLPQLNFDNTYARLPETFRQRVDPTPVPNPYLIASNLEAASLLDLHPDELGTPDFVEYFAGNRLLPGSEPVAMKYAGHQFGHFVPQLGDGRAILLGEVRNQRGEKWDLHLKGAGPTAFSRFADGRAVLRSSIREYLCCEAMHGLGIPTTRALCVIGTRLPVHREAVEPGALVLRMAPTHVRFGSFEVFAARNEHHEVRLLADYVIEHHFPHLQNAEDRYPRFLREVCDRTARLMAHWQAVGFMHGVMNTDNMSILGITLDYGPFGFMEDFDSDTICNHSDHTGRYAFSQQPRIGYWNVAVLAQALLALMNVEEARAVLDTYPETFNGHLHRLMCAKIGVAPTEGNQALWRDALDLLAAGKVDYTLFFRTLCQFDTDPTNEAIRRLFPCDKGFLRWAERYRDGLAQVPDKATRQESMNLVNPRFILRNYLAQVAIEKATAGDFSEVQRLYEVLRRPFDEQPEMAQYAEPAPSWGKRLVVSCSS